MNNPLMTEAELRQEIESFKTISIGSLIARDKGYYYQEEYISRSEKHIDDFLALITEQSRAYAETIIGEDVSHELIAERFKGQDDKISIHDAVHAVNDRLKLMRQLNKKGVK